MASVAAHRPRALPPLPRLATVDYPDYTAALAIVNASNFPMHVAQQLVPAPGLPAGKFVAAMRRVPNKAYIGQYEGELLVEAEAKRRSLVARQQGQVLPWLLQITTDGVVTSVDATAFPPEKRTVIHYVTSLVPHSSRRDLVNCEFVAAEGGIWLVATRTLQPGEPLAWYLDDTDYDDPVVETVVVAKAPNSNNNHQCVEQSDAAYDVDVDGHKVHYTAGWRARAAAYRANLQEQRQGRAVIAILADDPVLGFDFPKRIYKLSAPPTHAVFELVPDDASCGTEVGDDDDDDDELDQSNNNTSSSSASAASAASASSSMNCE